jgi:hypothetical protein
LYRFFDAFCIGANNNRSGETFMAKAILAGLSAALVLTATTVLAQDRPIKTVQNDIMDANNFGRMVMISTLNQLHGAALSRGKEEKVNLPMTVSLAEKTSGGSAIQCVQICTVIGGVPVCVCI